MENQILKTLTDQHANLKKEIAENQQKVEAGKSAGLKVKELENQIVNLSRAIAAIEPGHELAYKPVKRKAKNQ